MRNSTPVSFLFTILLLAQGSAHAEDIEVIQTTHTYQRPSQWKIEEVHTTPHLFPEYVWGQTKSMLRMTQNPYYISFDQRTPYREAWPRLIDSQSISNQEVNPVQNYEASKRKLLESIPVAPYLHFEKKNFSAGFLFWFEGRVNMFVKVEW